MARDDAALAAAIRALISDRGVLEVRVTPHARANALQVPERGSPPILEIRTTAAPEDGKANAAAIRLVAKALGIGASDITLIRGASSRHKLMKVQG